MAYKDMKTQVRKQRQRRRARRVRRLEIVLVDTSERDLAIDDFLQSLPRGSVAEYIKGAIMQRIERERQAEPTPRDILTELAQLRAVVEAPARSTNIYHQQPPEAPGRPPARAMPADDAPIALTVTRADNGQSGANFLASLMSLQGGP